MVLHANQGVDFNVSNERNSCSELRKMVRGKSNNWWKCSGLKKPTEGICKWEEKVSLTSPTVAISKGIGMVHHILVLVPNWPEGQQVHMEPKHKGMFMDYKEKAIEIMEEYAKKYNLHDPNKQKKVRDIPVGDGVIVKLKNSCGSKGKSIPTNLQRIGSQQKWRTVQRTDHLKEQGCWTTDLYFLSHTSSTNQRQITIALIIMRESGKSMGAYQTADIKEEISRLMVGRDVILTVEKIRHSLQTWYCNVILEYTNECGIRNAWISFSLDVQQVWNSDGWAWKAMVSERTGRYAVLTEHIS